MSTREDRPTREEREERWKARLNELEPALIELSQAAKTAYNVLRPLAKHVSTVERDYPLRHQQVQILVASGPEGALADYLMIAFGGNHDLILYHNSHPERDHPYNWQFTRSTSHMPLQSEETKIQENVQPIGGFGTGIMSLEVARYLYTEQIGISPRFDQVLCGFSNDFAGAEGYIQAFGLDISEAIRKYGASV